jgi:hypothetical protein
MIYDFVTASGSKIKAKFLNVLALRCVLDVN